MNLVTTSSSVHIPVTHFWSLDHIEQVGICFTIFQQGNQFTAVPELSAEDRAFTGLPEEIRFVYSDYCIAKANNMEEETLQVIKQILLELQVQDLN